jgi:tetratricopeptide (TPR) repeat protein
VSYEDRLAAFRCGDNVHAATLAGEALAAARAAGDHKASVDALCMLARVALRDGDLDRVAGLAQDAHEIAASADDARLLRMPLHLRAVAARMAGRYDEGRALYLESISVNDALGERGMAAAEHRNLAYLELRAGNVERARQLFDESVARFSAIDARAMAPYLTFDAATVAALDGDYAKAAERLQSAQEQWDEQGVVPDPDDAAEVESLRRRIASRS